MSGFNFTPTQESIISQAVDWYNKSSEQVFQITGNPGTGKSVVLNEIIRRLGLSMVEVAPMAYTGAASVVMRMKGLITAKTIHSWLYEVKQEPILTSNGKPRIDPYFNTPMMKMTFVPRDLKKHGIKLLVIDEGGSVPLSMRNHILGTGIKILVAGDLDQLPPVADNPAFLYDGKVHVLTDIMRQASNSPIIYLSQRAKLGLPIHLGNYGNVLVISEDEVTDLMISQSPVLLCGKNATRDRLINHIRNDILHKKSPLPEQGEKLICRRNNWLIEEGGINLTNGLTGTVVNAPDVREFDGKCFYIDFVPDIARDIQFGNIPCNYKYLEADRLHREEMKKMKFIQGNFFEFGYAQTVHLAQGSQWTHGMYFEEYMNPTINNRINYTAITRFSDMLIYVKPKRKYH